MNLTVGYTFDHVTVSLFGHNLLDREYAASGGNERVRLGAPRVLGVQLQSPL